MSTETKLKRDEEGESIDNTKYRGMIGRLLYLTASRPDIMFKYPDHVIILKQLVGNVKRRLMFRFLKGAAASKTQEKVTAGRGYCCLAHGLMLLVELITTVWTRSCTCTVTRCRMQQAKESLCCSYIINVAKSIVSAAKFSKKQTALAISTTEAEYVSAEKARQLALWMKQALIDYDVRLDDIPIMCDNKRAIDFSKNPVQHSRTKHIEIRHHFLRDNVQKGNISIEKVSSEDNIADILTKPLKREPFIYLRLGLGMMEQIY
ncbi:hypothetical protein Tco_0925186 [Tanacetum coccineum]|uniref:Copia protein n=1 Tax=Tanacetum coccineum TaxID=301880 RepID=A0ABQ5D712_9ASTR